MRKIFVSYSSADASRVNAVVDSLAERGFQFWFDRDAIRDADDIVLEIDRGLDSVDTFALFLSANYLKSEWTRAEYSAIFFAALSDERKIVIVQLDDDATTTIPRLLAARRRIRWTTTVDVADKIARIFETNDKPSAAPQAETTTRWTDLSTTMIDVLVTQFLENALRLEHNTPLVQLRVSVPPVEITMHVAPALASNEAILEDLRAERDLARLARRLVNEYQKSLTKGGLGVFTPAFQISMEESQEKFDRSVQILRDQMAAVAPRLTQRRVDLA